ncbi:MAG: glyceraldehyde 3-phosphate dehydrogenase NAD-binding domain-containing protein, partial [Candidatus Peregrinibacteria bacterium]
MGKRIAINGYGRIGRDLHRQILKEGGLEVVAINSRADASSHVNLLRHDSIYGHLDADVQLDGVNMKVNGKTVYVYQIAEPDDLPWKKHDVDLLVESTGKFTTRVDVDGHLKA